MHMGEDAHRRLDRRQRVAQFVRKRRQKFVLALVGVAHLVLPVAGPHDRAGHRNQCNRSHRPLQQGDIAELLDGALHVE